jgi:hypothetical protein
MAALVARVWRRLTCGRDHGVLMIGTDELRIECARCGLVSPGIVLDTHAIRLAWRFDSQRARFPRRRAS